VRSESRGLAIFLDATTRSARLRLARLTDLVPLDANPLADIRNTTRIRAVVLNGRYLDRAALGALLARAGQVATEPPAKSPH